MTRLLIGIFLTLILASPVHADDKPCKMSAENIRQAHQMLDDIDRLKEFRSEMDDKKKDFTAVIAKTGNCNYQAYCDYIRLPLSLDDMKRMIDQQVIAKEDELKRLGVDVQPPSEKKEKKSSFFSSLFSSLHFGPTGGGGGD